jgi:hypothetical protein
VHANLQVNSTGPEQEQRHPVVNHLSHELLGI